MAQFNSNRWRRVGASAEQLDALEAGFAALDPDAQERESARLAGLADSDLAAQLAGLDSAPGEGDAKGGAGGNDSEEPDAAHASPLSSDPQAIDSVAGHDA